MEMFEKNNFGNTARYYDLLEMKNAGTYAHVLDVLERYFTHHAVTSVLDMTCGTGAQAIPLARKGYRVTASDISSEMLQVARQKARDVEMNFHQGDMRSSHFGVYDAVIAILNSVGYLSRADFLAALENINGNLKDGGLFAFDNVNFDAVKAGVLTESKLIDTAGEYQGKKFVRFFQSSVDIDSGQMDIHWETYVQQGFQPMETFSGTWHRQIYMLDELEQILSDKGFRVLEYFDRYGNTFDRTRSFSVLVVAEKRHRRGRL